MTNDLKSIPVMLKDYKGLKAQLQNLQGVDVFAKQRELRNGMKTVAVKIVDAIIELKSDLRLV